MFVGPDVGVGHVGPNIGLGPVGPDIGLGQFTGLILNASATCLKMLLMRFADVPAKRMSQKQNSETCASEFAFGTLGRNINPSLLLLLSSQISTS